MATREENLKKINEELEQLSDEELEQVAGGRYRETAADSSWLAFLGLLEHGYCTSEIAFRSGTEREEKVKAAFAKVGIRFVYRGDFEGYNSYYFGNQSLKHEDALVMALNQAKKLKLGIFSKFQ